MQKIKKLHRATFTGENVVSEMTYTRGKWAKTHEYVQSADDVSEHKKKAVVLGNGVSRTALHPDLPVLLSNHTGMEVYGCNAIMRDFTPDFVFMADNMADEFVKAQYYDKTVVYASAQVCEQCPEKFYRVPQNPNWNTGALATYIACFDGARTVYLLGHDLFSQEHNYQSNVYAGTDNYPDTYDLTTEGYFEKSLLHVMQTYNDVDFVRVSESDNHYMPESWKYLLNLRQITFREFVLETDLG